MGMHEKTHSFIWESEERVLSKLKTATCRCIEIQSTVLTVQGCDQDKSSMLTLYFFKPEIRVSLIPIIAFLRK